MKAMHEERDFRLKCHGMQKKLTVIDPLAGIFIPSFVVPIRAKGLPILGFAVPTGTKGLPTGIKFHFYT